MKRSDQEAITAKKAVDPGTVTFAVIDAGVLSLSCYVLRNPSCPSAVSCFLGRSKFQYRPRLILRIFEAMLYQGLPLDVLIYSAVTSACDNAAA